LAISLKPASISSLLSNASFYFLESGLLPEESNDSD
jgi:hypothetical protein